MVAAWMSADTGVGPSIASNSQDCNGTWADLPQAASSRNRPSAVSQPEPAELAAWLTSVKFTEPNSATMVNIASSSPRSPMRLTTKAFLAASAAECRSCQKPISR